MSEKPKTTKRPNKKQKADTARDKVAPKRNTGGQDKDLTVKPVGRPTKYKPSYCKRLIEHQAGGFSFESFAGVVGVCFDTLYEWANTHKDFSDAKARAFAVNLLWWETQGNDMVERPSSAGCAPAIFNHQVNNRFRSIGWSNSPDAAPVHDSEDVEFVADFGSPTREEGDK